MIHNVCCWRALERFPVATPGDESQRRSVDAVSSGKTGFAWPHDFTLCYYDQSHPRSGGLQGINPISDCDDLKQSGFGEKGISSTGSIWTRGVISSRGSWPSGAGSGISARQCELIKTRKVVELKQRWE